MAQVPLDVFVNRGHGLTLSCLDSPSTSVLVYLSPRAYLSALRLGGAKPPDDDPPSPTNTRQPTVPPPPTPSLDIPIPTLRWYLTSPDVVQLANAAQPLATLVTMSQRFDPPASATQQPPPSLQPPIFPLISSTNEALSSETLDHAFPTRTSPALDPAPPPGGYFLDLRGIIMRRRATLQLSGGGLLGSMMSIGMMGMDLDDNRGAGGPDESTTGASGSSTWIDLLVSLFVNSVIAD